MELAQAALNRSPGLESPGFIEAAGRPHRMVQIGALQPIALWGRSSPQNLRQASIRSRASASVRNLCADRGNPTSAQTPLSGARPTQMTNPRIDETMPDGRVWRKPGAAGTIP